MSKQQNCNQVKCLTTIKFVRLKVKNVKRACKKIIPYTYELITEI